MDWKTLQKHLRDFAEERRWTQFHTPKNLSTALTVEAAELAELFQWKTPEESRAARMEPEFRTRIGEEVADVLLYLVQIADHTGVDLDGAVKDKLAKNALKYPVPVSPPEDTGDKPRPVQTHVLVDWENVQPKDVDIRALVPDVTQVWIFHGPSQKRVSEHQKAFGDAVTLIPISRSGKNALDFHLSYYMGYISSRNPDAKFVVIANDQGYGPMLDHANELGFVVRQVGFGPQSAAPKKAAAKKTPAKKVAAKKVQVKKVAAKIPAATKKVANKKTVSPAKAEEKTKATGTKSDAGSAASKTQTDKPKKQAPASVKAPAKTKPASVTSPPKADTGVSTKVPLLADEEKAYSHVLASLKKSKNKPARKVRLYGAVKALLGAEKPEDPVVERTVQRLIQEGYLEIDAKGAVTKSP